MGWSRRAVLVAGGAGLCGLAGCASPGRGASLMGPDLPQRVHRIAFGSCLNQDLPEPNWQAILDARPDLMVFGGDNVYASTPPWSLDRLEHAYAKLGGQGGFQRLRARVPVLATWDDHDMGLNDGGASFAHLQASKQAFAAFWQLPADDPRRQRPGLYHAVVMGPPAQRVQVILLDGRSFRSDLRRTDQHGAPGKERYLPDDDPAKTLLGEAQWAWLAEQLSQPAQVRLIVSGVQVIAQGHGWEGWHNLPREQARLLQLIDQTRANGVVLLSGDRHVGALYQRAAQPGQADRYTLTELTSSGLTHAWRDAHEAGPNRMGELVTVNHFALIELDWPGQRVVLQIRALADGAVLRELALPLPSLR